MCLRLRSRTCKMVGEEEEEEKEEEEEEEVLGFDFTMTYIGSRTLKAHTCTHT